MFMNNNFEFTTCKILLKRLLCCIFSN